jgi:uncharacterized protein YfbU (UPF0304 family)
MRLTPTERLILINQYEILNRLSDGSPYDDYINILRTGFEFEIDDRLFNSIDEVGMPKAACIEVIDILAMFDHLIISFEKLQEKEGLTPIDVRFRGFNTSDNSEVRYWTYARHLVEDQRRFKAKAEDLKGYTSMLSRYREALPIYNQAESRHRAPDVWLSAGEIREIIAPLGQ